jgi:hypothetical protein
VIYHYPPSIKARTEANSAAHKAAEGIRIQVEASKGVRALIASTLPEVWQIIHSGVVQEGKVDDVSEVFRI